MRDPTVVADVHVPINQDVELGVVEGDVLVVADGVVGMSTVVCRSEPQAVASAISGSSVSKPTVLFIMVVGVRLQNRKRTHNFSGPKCTNARFS
jgi:heme A synthase